MKLLDLILVSFLVSSCHMKTPEPQNVLLKPNYQLVFNQNRIDEIAISITPKDWQALQVNLNNVIMTDTVASDKLDKKLLVMPALVRFKDGVWNNAGLKYHTSKNLLDGFKLGESNLPLELDFDYFAAKFPETANQNFHGFSNLILDNHASDFSKIRGIIMNSLLEDLKITTTKSSLKSVKLNIGTSSQTVIYTLKEMVDENLIKSRFNETNFNLYRTNSKLKNFTINEFSRLQNGSLPGFGDVQRLINAVNRRNSPFINEFEIDPENSWKKSLEQAYDHKMFTRWLALNIILGNDELNFLHKEPYYIFSGTNTKTNFFYTFPHNSMGLGHEATATIDDIFDGLEANPLVVNIIEDPGFYADLEAEILLINKNHFTTTRLYPIIDRYYNQMRLLGVEKGAINPAQMGDIEELKFWINQRIESLKKVSMNNPFIQYQ